MSQIPSYKNVHNRFKLDGNSFRFNDLFEVAYSFIKEGKPHERIIGDFLMDWINPKEVIAVKTSGSTGAPKFSLFILSNKYGWSNWKHKLTARIDESNTEL